MNNLILPHIILSHLIEWNRRYFFFRRSIPLKAFHSNHMHACDVWILAICVSNFTNVLEDLFLWLLKRETQLGPPFAFFPLSEDRVVQQLSINLLKINLCLSLYALLYPLCIVSCLKPYPVPIHITWTIAFPHEVIPWQIVITPDWRIHEVDRSVETLNTGGPFLRGLIIPCVEVGLVGLISEFFYCLL